MLLHESKLVLKRLLQFEPGRHRKDFLRVKAMDYGAAASKQMGSMQRPRLVHKSGSKRMVRGIGFLSVYKQHVPAVDLDIVFGFEAAVKRIDLGCSLPTATPRKNPMNINVAKSGRRAGRHTGAVSPKCNEVAPKDARESVSQPTAYS